MSLQEIIKTKIELLNIRLLLGILSDNYLDPTTKYEITKPYFEREEQLVKKR